MSLLNITDGADGCYCCSYCWSYLALPSAADSFSSHSISSARWLKRQSRTPVTRTAAERAVEQGTSAAGQAIARSICYCRNSCCWTLQLQCWYKLAVEHYSAVTSATDADAAIRYEHVVLAVGGCMYLDEVAPAETLRCCTAVLLCWYGTGSSLFRLQTALWCLLLLCDRLSAGVTPCSSCCSVLWVMLFTGLMLGLMR